MLSTATVTSRSTLTEQDEEIILAAYRVVGCFTAPYSPGKAERLCRLLEAQVAACAASQAAYERYRNPDTAAETKPAMHDMQPYAGGR